MMRYLQGTEYDWKFTATAKRACLGFASGNCSQPRGKMLGGCDSLNGLVALRGNDRDYNEWALRGNPTWDWKNVLGYFKKSEGNQNIKLVSNDKGLYHSANGTLIIDSFGQPHPFGKVVLSAAKELGYEEIVEPIPGKWLGYTYAQGTLRNGRREGAGRNFLEPLSRKPNVHVIKNALVDKIEIVKMKATGVRFIYKGQQMRARNKKDVILSAGTLSSPQILMLSGIGPKEHLSDYNIPLVANLPVGHNLQDHVTLMIFFKLNSSGASDLTTKNLDSIYNLVVHNSGPLSKLGLRDLIAFLDTTKSSTPYPDVALQHFFFERGTADIQPYASGLKEESRSLLLRQNNETDMLGIAISLYRPKSLGRVKLTGRSIYDKPDIDLNFFDYVEEVDTLVRAIKQQIALTKTRTFRAIGCKFIRLPIPTCRERSEDEYYRCYVHNFARSNHHQVGTSKMGPHTDPEAVVDHHLRVKGIANLRQIDAGVMPYIPSGNTNIPTVMVAEKGASFIKMDWLGRN